MLYIAARSFASTTRSRYAHITGPKGYCSLSLAATLQRRSTRLVLAIWQMSEPPRGRLGRHTSAWCLPCAACVIMPRRFDAASLFERGHTQLEEDAVFEDGQTPKQTWSSTQPLCAWLQSFIESFNWANNLSKKTSFVWLFSLQSSFSALIRSCVG